MSNFQKVVVAALVAIAALLALLIYAFRFEYLEGKLARVNRFTGTVEVVCSDLKNPIYLTVPQCSSAVDAQKEKSRLLFEQPVTEQQCKRLHEDSAKEIPIDLFTLYSCTSKGY